MSVFIVEILITRVSFHPAFSRKQSAGVPITFLLGFYVHLIIRRWWDQCGALPWPDNLAMYLRALVRERRGEAEEAEEAEGMRRTVVRHALLSYTLCIREISERLRRRYPDLNSLVHCGLLRPAEVARLEDTWWRPIMWSIDLLSLKENLYK